MRAEVSSGRSDLASSSLLKAETPGLPERADRLDRRGAALGRGGEGRGADRDDLLGVFGAHRLDGVAGVDRAIEGVGRDDLDDVGDLRHVEQRRDARQHILGRAGRGRHDDVIGGRERDDQRGHRLREDVVESRILCVEHFLHASDLRGLIGGALQARTDDENMDRAADLLGGGDRLGGRGRKRAI